MGISHKKVLLSEETVKKEVPLSPQSRTVVEQGIKDLTSILSGKESRQIVIIGPCSAYPFEGVVKYFERLQGLQQKFKDKLLLVARVYLQKPRTTVGWTGSLVNPDFFGVPDMDAGIIAGRKLMQQILAFGFPIVDEAVNPENYKYFDDILSYVAIGARSSENQLHRQFASMLDIPVGIKNATSGDISKIIDSIITARHEHAFPYDRMQISSNGNPYAHLILRGGDRKINYKIWHIEEYSHEMECRGISDCPILIDCSHGNSQKKADNQIEVINYCIENHYAQRFPMVKGYMIESFIYDGSHHPLSADQLVIGKSLTDECLGFEKTEALLEKLYQSLSAPR